MDDKTNQELKYQRMMIVVRTFLRYDIFKLLKLVNSKSIPLKRRCELIRCWESHWQKVELAYGRKQARLQLDKDMEEYAKSLITRNRQYLESLEPKKKEEYEQEQNKNAQNDDGETIEVSDKYSSVVQKILNELKDDPLQDDSQQSVNDTQFQQDTSHSEASYDYKQALQENDNEQGERDETEENSSYFNNVGDNADEFPIKFIQDADKNYSEEKPITFDTDTPASPDDVSCPASSPMALTDEENSSNEEEDEKETTSENHLESQPHISPPNSSEEEQPDNTDYSIKESDDENRKEVKSE